MIWGNRYDRNWFFSICTQDSPLKLSNLGLFVSGSYFFYYKFNFTSSDQSAQTVFPLDSVLAGCIFLIFSSRLSSLLLRVFSYNFMCRCVISYYFSSFIYCFVHLNPLFFLVNLAKGLSTLLILFKEPALSFIDLFYSLLLLIFIYF